MSDSPETQAAQAYQAALRMLDKKYTPSYTRWKLAARFSLLRPEEISEIVSAAERACACGSHPVEPDYFLKIVKHPSGWQVYTPKYSGPFIFTETGQMLAFTKSIVMDRSEKVSKLKQERDKLDAQIKELES